MKLHKNPDFTPIGSYILVTDEEKQAAAGMLAIPDAAQSRPQHGFVVAAGDEVKKLERGHRIYFGKYGGCRIQMNGINYWIMKEAEVYGIVGTKVDLNEVFLK